MEIKKEKEYFIEDVIREFKKLIKECPNVSFKKILSLAKKNELAYAVKHSAIDFTICDQGENIAKKVYKEFNIGPDSSLFPKVVKIPFHLKETDIKLEDFLADMTYDLSYDLVTRDKNTTCRIAEDITEGENLNEKVLVLSFVTGVKIYKDAVEKGLLNVLERDDIRYLQIK